MDKQAYTDLLDRAMDALNAYNVGTVRQEDVEKDLIAGLVSDLRHLSDHLDMNWRDVVWLSDGFYMDDVSDMIELQRTGEW